MEMVAQLIKLGATVDAATKVGTKMLWEIPLPPDNHTHITVRAFITGGQRNEFSCLWLYCLGKFPKSRLWTVFKRRRGHF